MRVALAREHHDVVALPAVGPERVLGDGEGGPWIGAESGVVLGRAGGAAKEVEARVAARDPVLAVVDAQAPQQAEQRIGGFCCARTPRAGQ
jgi:hypothetical protein